MYSPPWEIPVRISDILSFMIFPFASTSRGSTSPFDLRELSMKRIILGDFVYGTGNHFNGKSSNTYSLITIVMAFIP